MICRSRPKPPKVTQKESLFRQFHPHRRAALIRLFLCGVVFIYVATLPPVELISDLTMMVQGASLAQSPAALLSLKIAAMVLSLLSVIGIWVRVCLPLLACAFGLLTYLISVCVPLWSYDTHLFFFLCALSFVDCATFYSLKPGSRRLTAFSRFRALCAIQFIKIYIGFLYLQAGISKVTQSGLNWYVEGDTLFDAMIEIGTPLAQSLAHFSGFTLAGSVACGLFEFSFLFVILWGLNPRLLLAICIMFHLGTWLILGISFWFLWMLFPAVFLNINDFVWLRRRIIETCSRAGALFGKNKAN